MCFQLSDVIQAIYCVSGESADGFGNKHINLSIHAVLNHLMELFPMFCRGCTDTVIGIDSSKDPFRIPVNNFLIMCNLCLIAGCLFFRICGNTAIGCHTNLLSFL